ncbi:photosystem II stability/assembly factor-like uncharacterized protein [Duganella sp. 1411]|jgi:photosystem II stability/assembly factor-like uncharacterized protein|uniref:YCF48-related protein n=1 Tax=Duganella sp. 1411 TaxID=2806572 RepID=UPI001AE613C4|nr:YCF48-related protein [Duganella sp. 1411]MBP1202931.1 photosystem II stability/assembly factor-like uncharacterized protein [Duganella sp. 1411]
MLASTFIGALALGALPAAALADSAPAPTATAALATTAARLRPAVMARGAARSVLLGAATAGKRIVAVGERGIILLSDDAGNSWRQAAVPVSVTLTAVRFADASNGVAVGHGGVILVSGDGGASWQSVMDGQRIATLALEAARAGTDAAAIRDAERLVADGADKPLLDVCLLGGGRMLAVGAYGLAFASADGGRTWSSWMDRIDNPKGLHLNAVRRRGDTLLIGGERGLALLSTDAGRTFKRLPVPYQGSFFSAELTGDGALVLAGLRGNVWRSADAGASWRQLSSPMPVTITASAARADGSLLFANQAGVLLAARQDALVPLPGAPLAPLNGVLALDDGKLLALSARGVAVVAAKPANGGQP